MSCPYDESRAKLQEDIEDCVSEMIRNRYGSLDAIDKKHIREASIKLSADISASFWNLYSYGPEAREVKQKQAKLDGFTDDAKEFE